MNTHARKINGLALTLVLVGAAMALIGFFSVQDEPAIMVVMFYCSIMVSGFIGIFIGILCYALSAAVKSQPANNVTYNAPQFHPLAPQMHNHVPPPPDSWAARQWQS